jgi:hypothetical protein
LEEIFFYCLGKIIVQHEIPWLTELYETSTGTSNKKYSACLTLGHETKLPLLYCNDMASGRFDLVSIQNILNPIAKGFIKRS